MSKHIIDFILVGVVVVLLITAVITNLLNQFQPWLRITEIVVGLLMLVAYLIYGAYDVFNKHNPVAKYIPGIGVIIAVIGIVYFMPPYQKHKIKITHVNRSPINCGKLDNPCKVHLHNNVIRGKTFEIEYRNIYLVVQNVDKESYTVQGNVAIDNNNHDWMGSFSLGKEENIGKLFFIFATSQELEPNSKHKICPVDKKSMSKGIFVLPTQIGSFKEERACKTKYRIDQITSSLAYPSSHLYADIYLGRANFKQYTTQTKTVTANLYYNGFKGRVIRVEVDWDEGRGWEKVDLYIQGEYYQIQYTYQTAGRKKVKYRITDETGQWVEAKDTIEIVEMFSPDAAFRGQPLDTIMAQKQ